MTSGQLHSVFEMNKILFKPKGQMDKGGHYDVEMKRWMRNRAL